MEELQSSRQAERQGVEQEFDTQQEKFHAEHGTVEEIYANAQDAAGDYLSQWEDSDEEGEDEEEEEGEWDDDDDTEYEGGPLACMLCLLGRFADFNCV